MNELLNMIDKEKVIIEKLLQIDNERNFTNITVQDFYNGVVKVLNSDNNNVVLANTLFITEGDPYLTLHILNNLVTDYEYIIYINQGFVAINEWLVERFKKLYSNINVILDIDINYNKYIGNDKYKVFPIGEKTMIEQVMKDFEVI